jgi:hypothetical protein
MTRIEDNEKSETLALARLFKHYRPERPVGAGVFP